MFIYLVRAASVVIREVVRDGEQSTESYIIMSIRRQSSIILVNCMNARAKRKSAYFTFKFGAFSPSSERAFSVVNI